MIKGVLFDLDGTLVRLPTDYEIVQEKLKNIFQTNELFSPLIPSIINKANGDMTKINEAFKVICEEEMVAVQSLESVKGIHEIMNFLKEKNCLLCLVTMQCRKAAMEILKKLGITDFFSNILTRDESYDRLEQIQQTLEKIKINPEQILVVGDTVYDVECAKKAGCQYRLFTTKSESGDGLKIIKNLEDVKGVVNQWKEY